MQEISVKVTKYADRKYYLMYYVDPITEKVTTKSTRKATRREAERVAGAWESEVRAGRYQTNTRISWEEFRERYETEKLSSLAEKTHEAGRTVMNHLERVINPKRLASLTSDTMSRFQSALRSEGMIDTTIAAHLGHLRAAMGWAVLMGMLPAVPEMHKPRRAKGIRKLMRGRPPTTEEFERMLKAVAKVRPRDPEGWKQYLKGLWLSGLRLEESLILSWDPDAPISIDLEGKHPRLRIDAEAEKGHQDRVLPVTPDFAQFLLETPKASRKGRVFRLIGLSTGKPISPKRVSRIVTAIGKKAGVVVNRKRKKVREKVEEASTGKQTGKTRLVEREVIKYASAHDLRRAFGTRWAPRVKPLTLRQLMRHESIDTTLKYYVDQDVDDIAEELWRQKESINTFINSGDKSPPVDASEHPEAATEPVDTHTL